MTIKVIVFQLQDEDYGLPLEQVRSIERMQPITRVPGVAPFIKGVINLRGLVIPIIDLRLRLHMEAATDLDQTRMIIVRAQDKEVGLIVDRANDVVDVPLDSIEPAPGSVGGQEDEYINGVVKVEKKLLMLLNLEYVLNEHVKVEG